MAEVHKYLHGDAFMLMWYACKCGHRESIWNSRDGVVPFAMSCPSCGRPTLQHADWNLDVQNPHFKPHRHQRFWRDGTPDEAEAIMRRRIEISREHNRPIGAAYEAHLIATVRAEPDVGEFQKGWPMLDIVP